VTAAVVLAAGSSSRLGEPKQLVMLAGETLLERAVRMTHEAGCSPIVVVLGASAERIMEQCDLSDAVVVLNEHWAEGMGSSVRLGVAAAGDAEGVVLMTCDQPAVTASHLRSLIDSGGVTASAYAGRQGVPAYFPSSAFAGLIKLRGDMGARELLRGAVAINLPNGEIDIDTIDDLARAEKLFS
jgi:molybdenum cofactor cytidylyltransferase